MRLAIILLAISLVACRAKAPVIQTFESKTMSVTIKDTTIVGSSLLTAIPIDKLDSMTPYKRHTVSDSTGNLFLEYYKDLAGSLQLKVKEKDRTIKAISSQIAETKTIVKYLPSEVKKHIPWWMVTIVIALASALILILVKSLFGWLK